MKVWGSFQNILLLSFRARFTQSFWRPKRSAVPPYQGVILILTLGLDPEPLWLKTALGLGRTRTTSVPFPASDPVEAEVLGCRTSERVAEGSWSRLGHESPSLCLWMDVLVGSPAGRSTSGPFFGSYTKKIPVDVFPDVRKRRDVGSWRWSVNLHLDPPSEDCRDCLHRRRQFEEVLMFEEPRIRQAGILHVSTVRPQQVTSWRNQKLLEDNYIFNNI